MNSTLVDKVRRALARRYHLRSIRERRTSGMVSITFDDFPKTAWTEGGRVLRDQGVRATYYVAGGLCGTRFDEQMMYDTEDLQALHQDGHEVGCHTFDHKSCLHNTSAAFSESLARNQTFVRERLGDMRLVSFAYPYGDATVSAKCVAMRHFATARGVDPGLNSSRLRLAQLLSVGLEGGASRIEEVDALIEEAARTKAWLILVAHDVSDRPGPYGCRPTDLDHVIRSARRTGLEILTVKGALGGRAFTE